MAVFCFILGTIAFLLMEHSLVFWLVFVPLGLTFIISLWKWITRPGLRMGNILVCATSFVAMIVAIVIVCIP